MEAFDMILRHWILSAMKSTQNIDLFSFGTVNISSVNLSNVWNYVYVSTTSTWKNLFIVWFVCFEFTVPLFHSFVNVTIIGEELQFFTYARDSWPLSSEGFLACHTYCDTGHPFIMVISENPWHSHLLPSV